MVRTMISISLYKNLQLTSSLAASFSRIVSSQALCYVMPDSTLGSWKSNISEDVRGTKLRMQINLSIAQFGNSVQNLSLLVGKQ